MFEQARKRLQKRLDLLGEIESMLSEDAEFANELRVALGQAATKETIRRGRPRATTDSPNVEKVVRALDGKDWTGTQDLRDASGLSKSQFFVAAKAGADRVESRQDPENRRALQWRLKTV